MLCLLGYGPSPDLAVNRQPGKKFGICYGQLNENINSVFGSRKKGTAHVGEMDWKLDGQSQSHNALTEVPNPAVSLLWPLTGSLPASDHGAHWYFSPEFTEIRMPESWGSSHTWHIWAHASSSHLGSTCSSHLVTSKRVEEACHGC